MRVALIVVGVLLLIALGLTAYVYHLGLRGVADRVLGRIAPIHRVDSVTRLPDGRIEFRGLYLQAETWRLSADILHGSTNMLPTFDLKTMTIGLIHLQSVTGNVVRARATTHSAAPSRVLKLPGITIDHLQLRRLDVIVDQVQVTLTDLHAQLQTAGSHVRLLRLDSGLQTPDQHLRVRNGALDLALTLPRTLRAELDWQRISATGAAAGHLRMQGPLDSLQGHLRLDAPLRTDAAVALRKTALGVAIVQLKLGTTVLNDLVGSVDLGRRPFPIHITTRAIVPALGELNIEADTQWTGKTMPISARIFAGKRIVAGKQVVAGGEVVAGKQAAAVTGQLDPSTWDAVLKLDGQQINAAQWLSGAHSNLHVQADIATHVLPPLRLDVALVAAGQLLKHPVTASADFAINENGLQLRSASLNQQANRMRVAQEGQALAVNLQLRNLHTLSTQWRGQLTATGTLAGAGELATRALQFEASAIDLAISDRVRFGVLHLAGRASLKAIDVQADGRQLQVGTVRASTLSAGLTGTADAHRLKLSLQTTDGHLQVAAHGAWKRATWNGVLDALTLNTAKYGRWALRSAVAAF